MNAPPEHPIASSNRARSWAGWLALALGAALVVFFGLRVWHQYQYQQRVDRGEVQVATMRGWMTLAYIEQAYGVPQTELRQALGLPPTGFEDRSFREWIEVAQLEPDASRRRVEQLILRHRAAAGAAR